MVTDPIPTPDFLHSFENYYTFTAFDLILVSLLLVFGFALQWSGRGPRMSAMRDFVNLTNTRGGNIFVLGAFSIWFFSAAMRLFYHALAMVAAKEMTPDDAILMMALQFATGGAFGASFGSMLKTMTGSDGQSRGTDVNGEGTKSTTMTTTATGIPDHTPPKV